MKIKRIEDVNLDSKTVLVRVDYNVPIKDGLVTDNTRIVSTEKTIKYLLEKNCKIVLMAHLGRPKGQVVEEFSLKPVVPEIERVMGVKVHFATDCVGEEADKVVAEAKQGEIVLLENLRFHKEETDNDKAFAEKLAKHGEVFVQDAFGALHRAHASTSAVAEFFGIEDKAIGFLVQKELEFLDRAIKTPQKPFTVIVGGAKVSDKIEVLNKFIDLCDTILIGGGMAYTFLRAQGLNIGNSLVEEEKVESAKSIIEKAASNNVEILLPADHVIATELSDAGGEPLAVEPQLTDSMAIPEGYMGLDIGPRTAALFAEKIKTSKTVFWNGPLGVFENDLFAKGSIAIAEILRQATEEGVITIVGGGDSLSVLKKAKIDRQALTHCSTGGGASMEFLEGKVLPGLKAVSQE